MSIELIERVLVRLGFGDRPDPDADGLAAVYRAWCTNVPFDNLRKLIALADPDNESLPGMDAARFFEEWLADKGGGTCWPSSNSLFELLISLGFDARRIAGQMRDIGITNHGSIAVRIDGAEWLADSSILSYVPLPLGDGLHLGGDPLLPVEIEHEDGEHVIWWDSRLNGDYFPCRILPETVDHRYYTEMFEASRRLSPFNTKLHVKQNRPEGVSLLLGNVRIAGTNGRVMTTELDRRSLVEALVGEFGYGEELIDRWIAVGGLDAVFAPAGDGPPPPANGRKRPTER